ncbi:MAG: antibiotic biosynthesis monooxygenase [Pseudomonadota bacterium]
MYLAMNRFKINPGHEAGFENVWRERDSQLSKVPGFLAFRLLKGPVDKETGQTLYASHTSWESEEAFSAWTKSEHFRQAHKNTGAHTDMYAGHPQFEGFTSVLSE